MDKWVLSGLERNNMGKQGFLNNGSPFIYEELTGSTSAAIGLDASDSGKFKMHIAASASQSLSSPQITIDQATNGNITITPNGSGRLVTATGITNTTGGITSSGTTTLSSLGAGAMQTNSSGVVSSSNGTNGQSLIGGGSAPAWANITAGANTTVTNGANTITIASTGGGGFTTGRAAFLGVQNSFATGVIADSSTTFYGLGKSIALTQVFDIGGNFNPGNGAGTGASFTAPTTNKYMLNMQVTLSLPYNDTHLYIISRITTTGKIFEKNDQALTDILAKTPNSGCAGSAFSVCTSMTAGDTATFSVSCYKAGFGAIDVAGPVTLPSGTAGVTTWVSGFLAD